MSGFWKNLYLNGLEDLDIAYSRAQNYEPKDERKISYKKLEKLKKWMSRPNVGLGTKWEGICLRQNLPQAHLTFKNWPNLEQQ